MEINEMTQPFIIISTGEIIERHMERLGWNQSDLAEVMGVAAKTVNYLVNNKIPVTPEIALQLGSAFGKSAEFWMNVDSLYRLRINENNNDSELIRMRAEMRTIMPVAEIRRKGWFLNDISCKAGIKNEYRRLFNQDSVPTEFWSSKVNYYARQTRYDENYTSLYCKVWYHFARMYSGSIKLPPYNEIGLKKLADNISSYTLLPDGVPSFINALKEIGVGFIKLSHLEKTYLDGACFLNGENPIIVFTGRYDRIDNFWFVLAHEVSHVLLHLSLLKEPIFDDLSSDAQAEIEVDADELASCFLNKKNIMENGRKYNKYITQSRLEEISRCSGVSIPVALGILQHEKIVEWRQFAKYREPVIKLIPKEVVMG